MQLPKVVLSWLSAISLILGVIIDAIHAFGSTCVASATVTCAPDPILAKLLIITGAVLAVIRGVMKDFGGSSDPVVAAAASAGAQAGAKAAQMAKLSVLFLVMGLSLTACSSALASPPRAFGVPLSVLADTVKMPSVQPCDADEPAVACAVSINGTAGTTPIVFGAVPNVARGGSISVSATFSCATPGQSLVVTVNVVSRTLNRSGVAGPAQTGTGTQNWTCPDQPPGQARPFTVIFTIGGG